MKKVGWPWWLSQPGWRPGGSEIRFRTSSFCPLGAARTRPICRRTFSTLWNRSRPRGGERKRASEPKTFSHFRLGRDNASCVIGKSMGGIGSPWTFPRSMPTKTGRSGLSHGGIARAIPRRIRPYVKPLSPPPILPPARLLPKRRSWARPGEAEPLAYTPRLMSGPANASFSAGMAKMSLPRFALAVPQLRRD